MTRGRWGKAGVRLVPADDRRGLYRHLARESREVAYRLWRRGMVVPHRITMALDLHGLDGPGVDHACGVEEPAVDEWEAGTRYPTWQQLEALAALTSFPPRYFTIEPGEAAGTATTIRYHLPGSEPPTAPLLRFDRDAIAAVVSGTPKEL